VTATWHDISLPLDSDLPTWPDSPGVLTTWRASIKRGDVANVTQLSMDVHSGTHVDAPCHFLDDGATVDDLGLAPFVGSAVVIDTGAAPEITAEVLSAASIPPDAQRLLLRTANSSQLSGAPFRDDYAALTLDGAQWLVDTCDLRLVGIDYLSIQRYTEPPDVHRTLLGSGLAILEGLCLKDVVPGAYELVCLPLRLIGVEGAPARAILMPPTPKSV
jgi:arylformamidase